MSPAFWGGYLSLIVDSGLNVDTHYGFLRGTPGGFVSVTAARSGYSPSASINAALSPRIKPGFGPAASFSNSWIPSEVGVNFGSPGYNVAIPVK